ncbi:LacI family DNA-binding transcriptional regulator [Vagococcus fluvialis]|jgi:DNA-binding LacI/PurR family transcriptional regulator|uniref:LacI family DNA-binding transcriptional regulator n=1 Tax=Vagococcus fluvialis TaxID=2738 RepID=UPI00258922C1|nr:LacI family DNA-binding transcriptional regulator [uncultured Vagococcus sp.]MDR2278741.1 LacI family transcriptional regulator [Vagococcus sp.]
MVSIKDISKKTGYAVTTVSRALNNHSDVNENTKAIIKQAAEELGYVPNLIAKNLVSGSSKTIGFITNKLDKDSLIDNFAVRVFLGMFEVEHSYEIILIHYDSRYFSSKSFDEIMKERQLEGAVVQGFDEADIFVKQAYESKYPTIFVDIGFENKTTSYVASDLSKALNIGMDEIDKAGFKDVCILIGKQASFITKYWLEVIDRYISQETKKNIEILEGKYSEEKAFQVVDDYLQTGHKADIYFCLSDLMAMGVYRALEKHQISVPNEVSVLGYDDIIVSKYLTPKLTTIAQNWEKVGQTSVLQLIELIEGNEITPQLLDVELMMRESFKRRN